MVESESSLDVIQAMSNLSDLNISRGSTIFAKLVVVADLDSVLDHPGGNFTVFVPDDKAFLNLGQSTLAYLQSEEGQNELQETLQYHIAVEGPHHANILDPSPVLTLQGAI